MRRSLDLIRGMIEVDTDFNDPKMTYRLGLYPSLGSDAGVWMSLDELYKVLKMLSEALEEGEK